MRRLSSSKRAKRRFSPALSGATPAAAPASQPTDRSRAPAETDPVILPATISPWNRETTTGTAYDKLLREL